MTFGVGFLTRYIQKPRWPKRLDLREGAEVQLVTDATLFLAFDHQKLPMKRGLGHAQDTYVSDDGTRERSNDPDPRNPNLSGFANESKVAFSGVMHDYSAYSFTENMGYFDSGIKSYRRGNRGAKSLIWFKTCVASAGTIGTCTYIAFIYQLRENL